MRKIITLATFAFIFTIGAHAQSAYDAAKLANKDLSGTARFVGMGGAMGALGGDISTIGTNPAGIGIYRSNDVMTTINFSTLETKSKYGGNSFTSKADRFSFNNVGVVLSTKVGNYTSLRYVNFGFNYNRSKSFYKNMSMDGLLNASPGGEIISPSYYMERQANGNNEDMYAKNVFRNDRVGWLSALAANSDVILYDGAKNLFFADPPNDADVNFISNERGGIGQYDFNVSFNFNDRFYLGTTIGAYDVNYRKYSQYDEDYGDKQGYNLQSWNTIDGSGFDFKVGAIVRPFEESPLRLGLAIHTPVFYNLTLATSARMESDFYPTPASTETTHIDVDTWDELGGDNCYREFRLRTPWKFNTSIGYTVGNYLALGAEYEYEDYSTMAFSYPEGDNMTWETDQVSEMMKGVHTFRIGAELKPTPEFALRAGYNYSSTTFKDGAWKNIALNSINTDMDYANTQAVSNYTLGLGYRGSMFYADVAYKFNTYKEDFYAFYDNENYGGPNYLHPTQVTNNNHQVFVTLGIRF